MNAEQFYERFKEAIKFIGYSWGEKEEIEIFIESEHLCLKSNGTKVSIPVGKEVTTKSWEKIGKIKP